MVDLEDRYDWIGDFHQGVAIVKKSEKYGAVVVGGKEIIPTIYDALSDFENGYAKAKYRVSEFKLDSKMINLSGQVQVKNNNKVLSLPNEYEWGNDFVGNICEVRTDGKPGVIDLDYNVIIPIGEYDYINVICDGLIEVAKTPIIKDKRRTYSIWGLVNSKGIAIIPFQYSQMSIYQVDACYIVSTMNDGTRYYGVIDKKGSIVLPFTYLYFGKYNSLFVYSSNACEKYEDNVFCPDNFLDGSKFGFMDSDFNPLTEPIYDIIESNDDYIIVRKDDKLGIINSQGKEIVKYGDYDFVEFDDSGLIKVAKEYINTETAFPQKHSKWGVIDSNGEELAFCRYSYVTVVEGPYILACEKIPIDDIYDGREDLDEDDIRYYDLVKGWEDCPSFGCWEIIDKEGNTILEGVEGGEDDAHAALECFLNNSDSDNMESYCSSCSKYGGYNDWDDNTIDEAFDGNPELTWNID